MMKIGRWEGNEIIYTIDVNGNSVNLMEDFDFTTDILGANMVISGMVVTEALTPDMTVLISAGIAKDFTVGSFLIGEDLVGTITASDPIDDRRDIIEVRRLIEDITPATRQFKDPITEDITESTIDTETQYITEIKVLAGTPGTGLSLAVETGWIKIAEILVPAASLTVVDANIYNIDAEKAGVNNTNWTTTMASIHRNGTISEMKTQIIDNESDIATNVTAIGLNTTHRTNFDDPHLVLRRENVTSDITMISRKKYLISGDYELTPPASPTIGDTIDILSDGYPKIIQNDAEHVMSLRNKYFTTKGVNGFIQMFSKERLELIYKGSGLNPIDPPEKLPALVAPEGTARSCAFSYDGTYLAVAHDTTPFITVYKRSGDTFTKLPALVAPEGNARSCAFSYDSIYLAVSHFTSPYITVYKRTGDTFTKVPALPSVGSTGLSCAFSYDGTYLAVSYETSPFIVVYKRSGDTFTKLPALPAPQSFGQNCAFSYDGTYLAVAHDTSPFITVYKRSGDTFTKLSALAATPAVGHGCMFSYDGTYLAVAHFTTPFITVYRRSGDTFTKLSALTALQSNGNGCAFSYDGTYLAVAHFTTPFITVYKRSGDTFTKLPALVAPEGTARSCAFSYDGTYLAVAHDTTPFITVYKTKEIVNKEWIVADFEVMNDEDPSDGDNGDLQYRFK